MSAEYSFTTRWHVPADAAWCWAQMEDLLHSGEASWWPAVVVTRPPAGVEVGNTLTLRVRSPLGYRLEVDLTLTEVERPTRLAAASDGDLAGTGRIEVDAQGAESDIRIVWEVSIRKRWMRTVAPALRPVFVWAHESVMVGGEHALLARLAASGGGFGAPKS